MLRRQLAAHPDNPRGLNSNACLNTLMKRDKNKTESVVMGKICRIEKNIAI